MNSQPSIRSSLRALRLSTPSSTLASLNHIPSSTSALAPHITVRGKRTKNTGANSAIIQRLVTQLSVISARKRQPRPIRLCLEDYLRHNVITRGWTLYQKDLRQAHNDQLSAQYAKIVDACSDLQSTSKSLASKAFDKEMGKRFSPELRVPTETPPNVIWQEEWNPAPTEEQK